MAVNREIIEEQNTCPVCHNPKLKEEKGVEVGNIFKLGTKFSAAFDFRYRDQEGQEQDIIMGCYGIGPSRLMGTIVEVYHDEKGIIWPETVAPFKVHLLSLNEDEAALKIYETLTQAGIEVLYDDRNLSAGEKFADADLIGCPYRVLISAKTIQVDSVELKKRAEGKSELIKIKDLVAKLK